MLLDYSDHDRTLQVGRIEPWYAAFGTMLATEIERADVNDRCRRWRSHGPTWGAESRTLSDGRTITWPARPKERVRPLSGASLNRLVAVLRRAYKLGQEKLGLPVVVTFPHYAESRRGEYITEDQCLAICANFQAKVGATVKADFFRLGYLTGIRKRQLRATTKRNVVIDGDTWKLAWAGDETKNGATARRRPRRRTVGDRQAGVGRTTPRLRLSLPRRGAAARADALRVATDLCAAPDSYGRTRGIVFHDTRHSAVTNLVASGTGEAIAMSITGHADPSVFKRYNVRRDPVQAEAAERRDAYPRQQRGTTPSIPAISLKKS